MNDLRKILSSGGHDPACGCVSFLGRCRTRTKESIVNDPLNPTPPTRIGRICSTGSRAFWLESDSPQSADTN